MESWTKAGLRGERAYTNKIRHRFLTNPGFGFMILALRFSNPGVALIVMLSNFVVPC
jgi:hypothetical protein